MTTTDTQTQDTDVDLHTTLESLLDRESGVDSEVVKQVAAVAEAYQPENELVSFAQDQEGERAKKKPATKKKRGAAENDAGQSDAKKPTKKRAKQQDEKLSVRQALQEVRKYVEYTAPEDRSCEAPLSDGRSIGEFLFEYWVSKNVK